MFHKEGYKSHPPTAPFLQLFIHLRAHPKCRYWLPALPYYIHILHVAFFHEHTSFNMRFSALAAFALATVAAAPAFALRWEPEGEITGPGPIMWSPSQLNGRDTFSWRLAYARAYNNFARELDLVSRQVLLPGESPDPACAAMRLSCK
ncbi:hypothetical protein B0H21DRAFT_120562 [Amylocystis lapponica]|nr:hypothetical protein B0H21DRAFT_120562 [Amylocystis lapponica]